MTRLGARGSVSVEVAVLLPAFLLLLVLATAVGRVSVAHGAVTVAAHDAARAASISRDMPTAAEQAVEVAGTTLAAQGLTCETLHVDPEVSGFAEPVGQPAHVTVTVSCQVSLTDLATFGPLESRLVAATFTSPIDTWRHRS